MNQEYDFHAIESKWQNYWERFKTFSVKEDLNKQKYYVLDMFPYPSAAGLHVGHAENYTASDIIGRYKKAQGFNVLHPFGWDAFGLPAEQHALTTGIHPAINTTQNISRIKSQIQQLGIGLDWDREINTTDPQYFKWTQWIFLQFFKEGLAYVDKYPVWWCPNLNTILANEEVIDGRSERGNHPVERRPLVQWVLRITQYIDSLLEGLKTLDWPISTKRQQQAWIGLSDGTEVDFLLEKFSDKIRTFTTRIDTIFGVTYLVISPEHPLVQRLTTSDRETEMRDYLSTVANKSDLQRTDFNKNKTGVFTGSYAIHPFTGERIPIWIADYVLMSYGTGAVMAVPAHDERDYDFAQRYSIPLRQVIEPVERQEITKIPYTLKGKLIHSDHFSGLDCEIARTRITQALEDRFQGKFSNQCRLRDWIFSRQRYWGEPIPILWISEEDYSTLQSLPDSPFREFLPKVPIILKKEEKALFAIGLPQNQLPLTLPELENYHPSDSGESPLARDQNWVNLKINLKTGQWVPASENPSGSDWITARRETNTMPQWAGSCWYYLRYLSPNCTQAPVDKLAESYWKTPDLYIGGTEHAVLHLLYARFWHQLLYKLGVVSTSEPFPKLFHQGMILGEDGQKMSKSQGNVINPEAIIRDYGADTLRLYEMFLGPLESMKPWSSQNIEGVYRFLKRIWKTFVSIENKNKFIEKANGDSDVQGILNETILKVTNDIENFRFNTAISQLMICLNELQKTRWISLQSAKIFLQLLAPFAPHIAEELWEFLGEAPSICQAPWPKVDPNQCKPKMLTIIFQVNGKLRGEAEFAPETPKETILALARKHHKVAPFLQERTVLREIYVPNKLVNFVIC